MSKPDERALAFLTARIQDSQLSHGVPSNFNQFVADTTLEATVHFGTVDPDVKAKIIEDANAPAGMAWLREHKKRMISFKTTNSAPKVKSEKPTIASVPIMPPSIIAAGKAARKLANAGKNEVSARWAELKSSRTSGGPA